MCGDGDICVFVMNFGFVEWQDVIVQVWYIKVFVIDQFVFEEDDWVGVMNSGFQEVFGVSSVIWCDDFEVWYIVVLGGIVLGVLGIDVVGC